MAGRGLDSLRYVVLTDDEGERPWPIARFLIDLEGNVSECFMSELSSLLNSVLRICKPAAVNGGGLADVNLGG